MSLASKLTPLLVSGSLALGVCLPTFAFAASTTTTFDREVIVVRDDAGGDDGSGNIPWVPIEPSAPINPDNPGNGGDNNNGNNGDNGQSSDKPDTPVTPGDSGANGGTDSGANGNMTTSNGLPQTGDAMVFAVGGLALAGAAALAGGLLVKKNRNAAVALAVLAGLGLLGSGASVATAMPSAIGDTAMTPLVIHVNDKDEITGIDDLNVTPTATGTMTWIFTGNETGAVTKLDLSYGGEASSVAVKDGELVIGEVSHIAVDGTGVDKALADYNGVAGRITYTVTADDGSEDIPWTPIEPSQPVDNGVYAVLYDDGSNHGTLVFQRDAASRDEYGTKIQSWDVAKSNGAVIDKATGEPTWVDFTASGVDHQITRYVVADTIKPTTMAGWFKYTANKDDKTSVSFEGLEKIDTSAVTSMRGLFDGQNTATGLDGISGWDTSSVTDLSFAFNAASVDSSIANALANWDVTSVSDFTSAFENVNAPTTTLNLSSWAGGGKTITTDMLKGSLFGTVNLAGWKDVQLGDTFVVDELDLVGATGTLSGNVFLCGTDDPFGCGFLPYKDFPVLDLSGFTVADGVEPIIRATSVKTPTTGTVHLIYAVNGVASSSNYGNTFFNQSTGEAVKTHAHSHDGVFEAGTFYSVKRPVGSGIAIDVSKIFNEDYPIDTTLSSMVLVGKDVDKVKSVSLAPDDEMFAHVLDDKAAYDTAREQAGVSGGSYLLDALNIDTTDGVAADNLDVHVEGHFILKSSVAAQVASSLKYHPMLVTPFWNVNTQSFSFTIDGKGKSVFMPLFNNLMYDTMIEDSINYEIETAKTINKYYGMTGIIGFVNGENIMAAK